VRWPHPILTGWPLGQPSALWINAPPPFDRVERDTQATYSRAMLQVTQEEGQPSSNAMREAVNRDGYVALDIVDFGTPENLLQLLSAALTERVFSPWKSLKPRAKSVASPVSYSGMYGFEDFPMHSDMANWKTPPRYLILLAQSGAKTVQTPIIDSAWLISRVGQTELTRSLVQPRRPIQGRLPLMRLLEPKPSGQQLFRWDQTFIKPASPAGLIGFSAVAKLLKQAPRTEFCLEKAGSVIVIDNWRMLHGRSSVSQEDRGRELFRAYLGGAT